MSEVVVIPEQRIEGKLLGRHVEHDPASKDHAFGIVVPPAKLNSIVHYRYGGPFTQDVGSCTGEAAVGACNTAPIHAPRTLRTQTDAMSVYELATALDDIPGQYPPTDTGSSGLAAAKALLQKGWITSYQHAFSVEEALSALQVTPIIIGVNWYEGFDRPDFHGLVKIAGQVRGGHEIEVLGFHVYPNLEDSVMEIENSWGAAWGRYGRFFMQVRTFRRLMAEQGDATILRR